MRLKSPDALSWALLARQLHERLVGLKVHRLRQVGETSWRLVLTGASVRPSLNWVISVDRAMPVTCCWLDAGEDQDVWPVQPSLSAWLDRLEAVDNRTGAVGSPLTQQLRRYVEGARVTGVSAQLGERSLEIDLERLGLSGERTPYRLVLELTPGYANLCLLDPAAGDRLMAAARYVSVADAKERLLLQGSPYTPPRRPAGRWVLETLLDAPPDSPDTSALLHQVASMAEDLPVVDRLRRSVWGVSPDAMAGWWAHWQKEASGEEDVEAFLAWLRAQWPVWAGEGLWSVVQPSAESVGVAPVWGDNGSDPEALHESFNAALVDVLERSVVDRVAGIMLRPLSRQLDALTQGRGDEVAQLLDLIQRYEAEVALCREAAARLEWVFHTGQRTHAVAPGETLRLPDWQEGSPPLVITDEDGGPPLTVSARWYQRAKKMERQNLGRWERVRVLEKELHQVQQAQRQADALAARFTVAAWDEVLKQVETLWRQVAQLASPRGGRDTHGGPPWLKQARRLLTMPQRGGAAAPSGAAVHQEVITVGESRAQVWLGGSARANHWLVTRVGRPQDVWLHPFNAVGPHAIVRLDHPTPETWAAADEKAFLTLLVEAAWLLVNRWSARRQAGEAVSGALSKETFLKEHPIIWTWVRHLRPVPGVVGLVQYQHEQLL